MRSTTSQAVQFCNDWCNRSLSSSYQIQSLREAVQQHSSLVKEAASGKGVDRHLFALKCIAAKNRLEEPEFFRSESWKLLNHSILSTSNCGNPALRLFGFGPVVQDGEERVSFQMNSFFDCFVVVVAMIVLSMCCGCFSNTGVAAGK